MKQEYHLKEQAIPEGYQIYEERLEVAGSQHYRPAGATFVKGKEHQIRFEPEPSNKYDQNAIRIIGRYKAWWFLTREVHLGYVPASVAKSMHTFGLSALKPRLLKTYLGNHGFVEILFQLLGPKGRKKDYTKA